MCVREGEGIPKFKTSNTFNALSSPAVLIKKPSTLVDKDSILPTVIKTVCYQTISNRSYLSEL